MKKLFVLCLAVLFLQEGELFSQVISNAGAVFTVSGGAAVTSGDFENNSGTVGNNGTVQLTGNYVNKAAAVTSGNGYYTLKGNWTNNGTFSHGTSTVTFNGNTKQVIAHGTGGETFYKLFVNKQSDTLTQTANPLSNLTIQDTLKIAAGTLGLGSTTKNLVVYGNAIINGSLSYNSSTLQTSNIIKNLSGSGKIDMSAGSLPHILNLSGSTNAINQLTTSDTTSIVNYKGTAQTVFPSSNYRNLILSNTGTKTLQGNSVVGENLRIEGAATVFDLGSTTSSLSITDSATVQGALKFSGAIAKTVNVGGELSGAGSIDMTGAGLSHVLNLSGSENSIGSYSAAGSNSTVDYVRDDKQTVFTSEHYHNLKISGDSAKTLNNTISLDASGVLSMLAGDINSNGNILKVSNSDLEAVNRVNGSVIGKLQRSIANLSGDYLYPVGTGSSYNPMKIKFQNLNEGPLTAEYRPDTIGNVNLPVVDADGDEIWRSLPEGYWSLTADASMASTNYDVKLNYHGFSGIDSSCRIIKRTNEDTLFLEGQDGSIFGGEIARGLLAGISTGKTDFAIGKGRPNIVNQPLDSTICEGLNSLFKVYSNRQGIVKYQWQVDEGGGYVDIPPISPIYSNSTTPQLSITKAGYDMNGYGYRVIVTDPWSNSNNSKTALLPVNTNPTVNLDSIDFVSCLGASNGAVYVEISSGTPGYKYRWNYNRPNGSVESTKEDLLNAKYGKHYLTVIDTNQCVYPNILTPVNINEFIVLPAVEMGVNSVQSRYGIDIVYNVSCFGRKDGEISVTADGTGDPSNYDYNWKNLTTNKDLNIEGSHYSGLGADAYLITITDSLGCEGNKYVTLSQPDPISVTRTDTKYPGNFDISCFGLTDGIINLNVTGGHTADNSMPEEMYFWNKSEDPLFSEFTRNIDSLSTGEYILAIQDSLNCFIDTTFTYVLNSPDELVLDSVHIADFNGFQVSCKNSSNGNIDPFITGGYGDFVYDWSTTIGLIADSGSRNQSDIPAGDYHLDLKDDINCPAAWDFVLTEPDTIAIDTVLHRNHGYEISCFDGNDGSIELNTTGGITTLPYAFVWESSDGSGLNPLVENQSNLSQGNYTVTITDANDCKASWDFLLKQPNKLITHIDSFSIACFNNNTGETDLTVTEGVGPYTYLWNTGSTEEDLDSLYTGTYYVEITDANLCKTIASTQVTEPLEILIDLDAPIQFNGRMISCFGESDAIVNSVVTGGSGAYTYTWKRGSWVSGQASLTDMPAGLYFLTITDGNLCEKRDSILVEQPLKLKTEVFATEPACFGKTDGEITLIIQGGTPKYSILWDKIGQEGQTASNLGVGHYDVVITDINLCVDSAYAELDQPQLITLNKPTESFIDPDCPDIFNGSIMYEIEGGTQPYDMVLYNLSNGRDSLVLGDGNEKTVSDLEQGTYRLQITDNNTCVLSDTSTLKAGKAICISAPNAFTPNGDGVNDTWMIEQMDIYPDAQVEIYNRWGELIYYASKGYTKPWDGTYKGRVLPIDSYFYVIDLKNGRDAVSGDITIIR